MFLAITKLQDFFTRPSLWSLILQALHRVWFGRIFVPKWSQHYRTILSSSLFLFLHCKVWIRVIFLIKVAECVIDLAMLALVRPDVKQQVSHRPVSLGHFPVADCHVWCHQLFPFRKLSRVEIGKLARICDDCFFFEITDKSMTYPWRDEVSHKHGVEEDSLGATRPLVSTLAPSSLYRRGRYPSTISRMNHPGSAIFKNVRRCIRSLNDSSYAACKYISNTRNMLKLHTKSDSIHPWSRSILLSDLR